MKEKWKQLKKGAIIESCCMLILGILMAIWPDISALAVCIIIGVLCILAGVYELVRYFKLGFAGMFFRFDFMLGICSILLGILLLVHRSGAVVILPIAVGIYMLLGSVSDIQVSVEMRRFNLGNWKASLAFGIISIIFAFFLLLNPFRGATALMVFIGISLIIESIQSFYSICCISKAVKESKNDRLIDVEWKSVDE